MLPFPEYNEAHLRKVLCGPYAVATSGPRIVENFLDMAHFGFVHDGILGDHERTEVRDCKVEPWSDGAGGTGILATECFFWQPQTNSLAHGGSEVEYTYRVVRPFTAILTKVPEAQHGFREAISLHVQPVGEEASRVWIVLAMTNFDAARAGAARFPGPHLPAGPAHPGKPGSEETATGLGRAELHMRWDRMSVAYRRYLAERGLRYDASPFTAKRRNERQAGHPRRNLHPGQRRLLRWLHSRFPATTRAAPVADAARFVEDGVLVVRDGRIEACGSGGGTAGPHPARDAAHRLFRAPAIARLHRRPHPLSPDRHHRQLRQAPARLAERLHLSR